MQIANTIKRAIRKNKKQVIVFPEGEEERTIKACKIISRDGYAQPILLGDRRRIQKKLGAYTKKILIIDPQNHKSTKNRQVFIESQKKEYYLHELFKILNKKGFSSKECSELIKNPLYFGLMMVKNHDADGLIAGAISTTAELLRPAFRIIGSTHKVCGVCILESLGKTYLFADCSVIIRPTAQELADIAVNTAKLASCLGIKPRVAMLSFSTHGSAQHEEVEKIKEATALAKKQAPSLIIDGEIQLDAAIVPDVMKVKCPGSRLKGRANVLVFPDLNAGNIGYKLVERFAKARAIGPVLVGMKMPVNDLSRGCSVRDIVDLTLVTAFQAIRNQKARIS